MPSIKGGSIWHFATFLFPGMEGDYWSLSEQGIVLLTPMALSNVTVHGQIESLDNVLMLKVFNASHVSISGAVEDLNAEEGIHYHSKPL